MASSIKGIFVAVELDQTALKKSVEDATKLLKKEFNNAKEVIDGALDINEDKIKTRLKDIADSIRDVQNEIRVGSSGKGMFTSAITQSEELRRTISDIAKNAGVSADKVKSSFSRAFDAANIENTVNAFSRYVKLLQISNKEAAEHAKELGITGEALDRITQKYNKLNAVSGGESFMTSLKNMVTTGNMMAALQASIATLGANLSIAGGVELGKSMVTTTIQVDSLRTAFESIYKDGNRAAAELEYIRQVTDELGLEFYGTAEAAKGFFAAAQTSELKDDAEEIFHAFLSAISALKMTDEKAASVFLAVSQMMSKGKISAEEMRQQLAEHLPGAVQMLASAMGVSLQKLDKMFEAGEVGLENLTLLAREVEKVYGEAGAKAGNALLGQLNKLRSEWTDFKAAFVNSDDVTRLIGRVRTAVASLKDNIDNIKIGLVSLTYGFGAAFSVGALKGVLTSLSSIRTLVITTTKELKSGAAASAAFTAGMKASNMSFIGIAGTIGALVTIGTTLWQVWNKGAEKAKYSADDFRNGLSGISDGFEDLSEKANKSTKDIQELIKTRLRAQIDQLKTDLEETANSLPNLADAIRDSMKGRFVDRYFGGDFEATEQAQWSSQQEAIRNTADEVQYLYDMIKSGQTDLDYIPSYLEEIKERLKLAGLEGSEAWKIVNNAVIIFSDTLTTLPEKMDALKKSMEGVENVANRLAYINPFKLFGSADSIEIENLKKQANLDNDKRLSSYIGFLTGGNLKTSEGKKFTPTSDEIKDIVELYKSGVQDLSKSLQMFYGISEDVTDAIDEQVVLDKRLEDQRKNSSKSLSNRVRLEEDYAATLSGLMAKYNEMQKLQGLPMDSLERSLVEVGIKATELDTKLEKLKNKMVKDKVDPSTMALIELYSKQVNAADIQDQLAEKYQPLVEQAKSAWNEIAEATGQANEIMLNDTRKTYDEMEKALKAMYDMNKISADEYVAYMAGINEQRKRQELELDTTWQAGIRQGAQSLADETANYAKQWAEVGKSAFTELGNTLADFATSTEKTWKNLSEAFTDLANSIINDLARMAAQTFSSNLYSGLFGGASSGGLLGGFLDSIGSLFFANGGVMAPGSLSAYSNGVYSSPTYFSMTGAQRFAKGGVFGEAGPEAIMPLTTMPNGRLGVAATGVGGGDVQINIINSTGEKVSTRQSNNTGGGKTIDVMIGDVVAKQMSTPGTKLNRSVSAQTGSRQSVVRR